MSENYGADQITVLEGLEAVRKRPGMYIGNTGKDGLHRCIDEIVANSVDEYMAKHASKIKLVITKKQGIYVADDGRGIPTDIHSKTGKSALETILTVLHAGGKFDQKNYRFSGGLHGVGASVVNALASTMKVWVLRDKMVHFMEFSQGKTVTDITLMTQAEFETKYPEVAAHQVWDETGTIIFFQPDKTIFETTTFDIKEISTNIRQTAYLNKGLQLTLEDQTIEPYTVEVFDFPNGIYTYLEHLTEGEALTTPIVMLEGELEGFQFEAALAYGADYSEKMFAFTNGIINPEHGAHVTGFKGALTKLVNTHAINKNVFKKEERFTSDDLKEGLRVVISIKMADPQFTSQSKVKLGSTIARTLVDRIFTDKFGTYLEENPNIVMAIIQKAGLAMRARMAAKAARENVLRKGVLESTSLPGKLADCSDKDPAKCEIFIVEGDSAGGSAKQGRDRHIQAILPLRGKVLNTEKATLDRILNYEGIKNMVIAFGCGIGEKFDATKLRYHKIILMADADVDGAHITTLLLTFLYRYLPTLIEEGYIYMAQPPLYRVSWGKQVEYVFSDVEKDAVVAKIQAVGGRLPKIEEALEDETLSTENAESGLTANLNITTDENAPAKAKKGPKIEIQRYKGLGEMSAQQLWETTMDPETRLLWQVTVGEAALANQVFEDLMGSDVEPRKKFIQDNAVFVEIDDIG
jgi:DNA gyrase subunit B